MSHGHIQVREMDKLAVGVSKPQRVFAGYARRPLTGRNYMTLVERGCFKEERVELIDGEVVTTMMSPMREPHAWVIQALTQFFAKHANGCVVYPGPVAPRTDGFDVYA